MLLRYGHRRPPPVHRLSRLNCATPGAVRSHSNLERAGAFPRRSTTRVHLSASRDVLSHPLLVRQSASPVARFALDQTIPGHTERRSIWTGPCPLSSSRSNQIETASIAPPPPSGSPPPVAPRTRAYS